jgi:hypothetical protein
MAQAATKGGQACSADDLALKHGRKQGDDGQAADGRGRVGEAGDDCIHVF